MTKPSQHKVNLKVNLVSKIREALESELDTITEKPALSIRERQVRDLLEKYRSYPEENFLLSQTLQSGSVVLVIEEWWDEPRERWYFVGFGGEMPVLYSGRRFQVVASDYFKNKSVGHVFQSEERLGTNEMTLSHRIVYAI